MRHFVITFMLLLGAANLSAQSTWTTTNEEQYKSEIRQKLNLDYSMPDYTTSKVDPKVMGPRLTSILRDLGAKYKQDEMLSILSMIQCHQIKDLDYCTIKKMSLKSVTKTENTITIRFKTKLDKNPLNIKNSDLVMTFIDGVSENRSVNSLIMQICNYIK